MLLGSRIETEEGISDQLESHAHGDLDILAATADCIAWYEDQERGSFGTRQIIWLNPSTLTNGPERNYGAGTELQAVDIDSDGDLDSAAASANELPCIRPMDSLCSPIPACRFNARTARDQCRIAELLLRRSTTKTVILAVNSSCHLV